MMRVLENPTTCPHGNPIPGTDYHAPTTITLDRLAVGQAFVVSRIPEELEFTPGPARVPRGLLAAARPRRHRHRGLARRHHHRRDRRPGTWASAASPAPASSSPPADEPGIRAASSRRRGRRGSGSVVRWRRARSCCGRRSGWRAQRSPRSRTSEDRPGGDPPLHRRRVRSLHRVAVAGPDVHAARSDARSRDRVSRPTDHDLPFSTWSSAKLAEFLVAEGVVDDISTRACGSCSARKTSRFKRVKTFRRVHRPGLRAMTNRVARALRHRRRQGRTPGPATRRVDLHDDSGAQPAAPSRLQWAPVAAAGNPSAPAARG